jgi:hypothetical protein
MERTALEGRVNELISTAERDERIGKTLGNTPKIAEKGDAFKFSLVTCLESELTAHPRYV